MLICLLGSSGVGKNTLIERITKKWDLHIMPTATTRSMRPTEFNTRPYVFLTEKEFNKKREAGEFVEVCEVHKGNQYGTLRSIYDKMEQEGKVLIKDIDVDGFRALKEAGLDVVSVFIKTSSLAILKERLALRGESAEDIKKRLSRAAYELKFEPQSDYVIVNDDILEAENALEDIIRAELDARGKSLKENNRKDYFVVYNSAAGKGKAVGYARDIAERLTEFGDVELVCSTSENYIRQYFKNVIKKSGEDAVVVSVGGDGTLGSTIDAVIKGGLACSMAVFPCGTANDFSHSLHAKKSVEKLIELLKNTEPVQSDVALVNDSVYSIHAIGAGNFGHGSMEFSSTSKAKFGMLAYWARCVAKAFRMKAQKLKVTIDGDTLEDDFLFFYLSNGNVAGGFHSFAPHAEINDGAFDFVGIRKCNIFSFAFMFLRLLFGKHEKSKKVIMKKGSEFNIEPMGEKNINFIKSDVDGNVGPELPLNIKIISKKISIYTEKI